MGRKSVIVAITFLIGLCLAQKGEAQQDSSRFSANIHAPVFNHFALDPDFETRKNGEGFQGFGLGVEWRLAERSYTRLEYALAVNSKIPIGTVDYEGEVELFSSTYFTLVYGFRPGRFAFDAGLSIARNTWNYTCFRDSLCDTPTRPLSKQRNTAYGLAFHAEYQIGKSFYAGLLYRPTFLRASDRNDQAYEHLASVVIGWRLMHWPRVFGRNRAGKE